MTTSDTSRPHALYRFYNAAGELLYVGITLNPAQRWAQHRDDKPWWHDVARIDLKVYPSRIAVLEAERAAIVIERPRHNVIYNKQRRTTHTPAHLPVPALTYSDTENQWTFRSLKSGYERTTDLYLYWGLNGTSMSDDWAPDEIDALELLQLWLKRYNDPRIYWTILPVHETAPFQPNNPWSDSRSFLSYFSWPHHAITGDPINFNRLPVMDLSWNEQQADKGGFFQEATGWKPSPGQGEAPLTEIFSAAGLTWAPIP